MHGEISQPNKHVACFLSSMASWEQTVDAKLKEEVMRLQKRKEEQEEVAKRQVNMTTLYQVQNGNVTMNPLLFTINAG